MSVAEAVSDARTAQECEEERNEEPGLVEAKVARTAQDGTGTAEGAIELLLMYFVERNEQYEG